ncbi:unnamed protein product [Acanthosepion pharaonis]|uniref:Uncharacterized protein n=1 Tax=Acanthosepion pharaonis TaxID=158019 RepID=A0A812BMS7_ACAPH|nr:unnamed protein product [Sepia pharaonis]
MFALLFSQTSVNFNLMFAFLFSDQCSLPVNFFWIPVFLPRQFLWNFLFFSDHAFYLSISLDVCLFFSQTSALLPVNFFETSTSALLPVNFFLMFSFFLFFSDQCSLPVNFFGCLPFFSQTSALYLSISLDVCLSFLRPVLFTCQFLWMFAFLFSDQCSLCFFDVWPFFSQTSALYLSISLMFAFLFRPVLFYLSISLMFAFLFSDLLFYLSISLMFGFLFSDQCSLPVNFFGCLPFFSQTSALYLSISCEPHPAEELLSFCRCLSCTLPTFLYLVNTTYVKFPSLFDHIELFLFILHFPTIFFPFLLLKKSFSILQLILSPSSHLLCKHPPPPPTTITTKEEEQEMNPAIYIFSSSSSTPPLQFSLSLHCYKKLTLLHIFCLCCFYFDEKICLLAQNFFCRSLFSLLLSYSHP